MCPRDTFCFFRMCPIAHIQMAPLFCISTRMLVIFSCGIGTWMSRFAFGGFALWGEIFRLYSPLGRRSREEALKWTTQTTLTEEYREHVLSNLFSMGFWLLEAAIVYWFHQPKVTTWNTSAHVTRLL